jgi:hypothetical protein
MEALRVNGRDDWRSLHWHFGNEMPDSVTLPTAVVRALTIHADEAALQRCLVYAMGESVLLVRPEWFKLYIVERE